ncbi:hypothetical protein SLEP1_g44414 [Rubroshorea leprosula]|uniref:Uncharacterized protein n=1 Tax=Rubroshorea leprosula TaxID=152421 RepID=A0AAV5LG36_9ROSI|nr:hypothetical protein SLEP1_g44414 [Rubroshorea leprosula]
MATMQNPCPIAQPSNCPPQLPEPPSPLHSESLQPPLHPIPNPESPQPPDPPSPLHLESLHSISNLELSRPPEPPFPLDPESLQPPLPSIPNIESPQLPPRPPSSMRDDLESQQVHSYVAQQNLQWQNAILAFCFTSAIQISLQFAKSQSKPPLPFSLVSFAILLTFALISIAKMISRELTKVSQVLENVAFLIATATFCYTTTIPFSVGFKCVVWSIFTISLLILVIYKCFCYIVA